MKTRLVFIAYVIAIIGVISLGFGTAILTSEKRFQEQVIQNRKEQSIMQLSNICERAFYENSLIFEGFRNALKEEVGFYSASCLDTEGNELDFTKKPALKKPSSVDHREKVDPNLFFDEKVTLPTGGNGEEIVAPLLFGGQQAGFAKIVFDQDGIDAHLKKTLQKTLKQLFLLSIFPMLLAVVGIIGFLKSLERLRDLNEKKKELINSVTHEFRSPLTAIQSFCGLMLKGVYGTLKSNQHETISIIQNNALRLSQFVDDLLAMAAFESKENRLFVERLDLVEFVRGLEKTYKPLVKAKKVKLRLHVPKASCYIETDRSKLLHIMENLISNAFKYTEKGYVEIGIVEQQSEMKLYVEDTGVGIDAKDKKQIFDSFFRSDRHARSSIKGTGLGLTIAKSYADLLKARVDVESVPGKGSRFSVVFGGIV